MQSREEANRAAMRITALTKRVADGEDPVVFEEQARRWLELDLSRLVLSGGRAVALAAGIP